nr:hypothetical protein [Tanacetum cinerariifolium]
MLETYGIANLAHYGGSGDGYGSLPTDFRVVVGRSIGKEYDEMIKRRIKTPSLDQTEGRREGILVKMLTPLKIQGQRKRSLQAPLKMLPNLITSLSASLSKQKSQVILLKNQACSKIKSSSWWTMMNNSLTRRHQINFRPPHTWITKAALTEEPPTSFDEFKDTSFDFSAFVLNRIQILNLTQEILVGSAFNLLKGTCKSITELEYHLEECSKATTERLDWYNHKNKPYSFDLRKPLSLIQDHRGRHIIPKDYFINKDLKYLKGGDASRQYSTSVKKTKAATYELKWIENLVSELWSPVVVNYDQHAYFGTSHWGSKCQRFYGYASNLTSSKDVYSRRRITTVTRLGIMKKYDYSHLEEIEVHRDDQQLYKFKEGDFKRLCQQDIEDMNKDGISAKKHALVMVQEIDKQLYQRRLMRNLEKFIGGRPTATGKDHMIYHMMFSSFRSNLVHNNLVNTYNFKKDEILKLFKLTNQERYGHVGPKVTTARDGKDYMMVKIDYAWLMISRSSRSYSGQVKDTCQSLKLMITMPYSQEKENEKSP